MPETRLFITPWTSPTKIFSANLIPSLPGRGTCKENTHGYSVVRKCLPGTYSISEYTSNLFRLMFVPFLIKTLRGGTLMCSLVPNETGHSGPCSGPGQTITSATQLCRADERHRERTSYVGRPCDLQMHRITWLMLLQVSGGVRRG